ncbi:MAG: glycosyltransferase family 2 protein [Tannerellaceae bacterium]|nr:glycosyltransferase family 2 protein [Tannerellaceae bacterium]
MSKLVSIVVPAYNEEGNIEVLASALSTLFETLPYRYELIFINDGSKDRTQEILEDLSREDHRVFYIELSRNFGHQPALKAGIDTARGDCIISMDCDLQHPPQLILEMLMKWEEGYDVVYTIRKEDKKLPYLKRKSSKAFYQFCNRISDIEMEDGTADFRLLDRKVAQIFSSMQESDLFIRGMIKWLGFKQYGIEYEPAERFSGTTKYNVKRMVGLAIRGITSFSVSPLYIAIYVGLTMSVLSFLYLPYVLYSYFMGDPTSGWSSLILTIVFFNGLTLLLLGVMGIYIGKLFVQSKNRPNYIVRTTNIKE